jgi:hypothetical protein
MSIVEVEQGVAGVAEVMIPGEPEILCKTVRERNGGGKEGESKE